MNIVSYRGPGMSGGVSTALARIWEESASQGSWWYMKGNALQMSSAIETESKPLASLSQELIQGHYRFCNEFLWPVLHDLPQYASLNEVDREHYQKFNEILSRLIAHSYAARLDSAFFVQDYQLALMPHLLKRSGAEMTMIFLHVPWPKHVRSAHARLLTPIARAMLAADIIGFHTAEYGHNFMSFVRAYLPEYSCDPVRMLINRTEETVTVFVPSGGHGRPQLPRSVRTTEIMVAPLGLDTRNWSSLASNARATLWQPWLTKGQYVLSVDRADYTKGIIPRIGAIDTFFEKYPQWRGKLVFAQVCGHTRAGLPAYDKYWQECRELASQLQDKWSTGNWQPLLWFERQFSAPELSLLYRNAAVMLVNPIRDGLNLTAKEYIACQGPRPGVLVLSAGAGAWHELRDLSLEVKPEDPGHIADTIYQALTMSASEKSERMRQLCHRVERNTLDAWWQRFKAPIAAKRALSKSFSPLREIS